MNTDIPSPLALRDAVQKWVSEARKKLMDGSLTESDLDELSRTVGVYNRVRQRLLYLHADVPSPRSAIMAMYLIEPVPGGAQLYLNPEPKFPYRTVHDAILDGWQILQVPDQRAPIDDRQIDVQGYEFILQKLEVYHD